MYIWWFSIANLGYAIVYWLRIPLAKSLPQLHTGRDSSLGSSPRITSWKQRLKTLVSISLFICVYKHPRWCRISSTWKYMNMVREPLFLLVMGVFSQWPLPYELRFCDRTYPAQWFMFQAAYRRHMLSDQPSGCHFATDRSQIMQQLHCLVVWNIFYFPIYWE